MTAGHRRSRVARVAAEILEWFPSEIAGLKFHILDCGCLYFQPVYQDGSLDPLIARYRDEDDGPCEVCTLQVVNWREMVVDYVVIYRCRVEVSTAP
jgi:hypothetical protein